MLEFDTRIKRWGNSFGLLIPKQEIDQERLKEEEELHVIVIRKNKAIKESFGLLKEWHKTAQELKDRTRRDLYAQ